MVIEKWAVLICNELCPHADVAGMWLLTLCLLFSDGGAPLSGFDNPISPWPSE